MPDARSSKHSAYSLPLVPGFQGDGTRVKKAHLSIEHLWAVAAQGCPPIWGRVAGVQGLAVSILHNQGA